MTGNGTHRAVASFPLVGTSAIVTGSGQGIGYDIARHLMAAGADVLVCETIRVDGGAHMRGLPNYWQDMAPVLGLPEVTPGEWRTPAAEAS
jgi:short chain dehydrogenase